MPDIFPLASIISQFSGGALEVRLRATEEQHWQALHFIALYLRHSFGQFQFFG